MSRLTKAQAQDEQILAAILAGARSPEGRARGVGPHNTHDGIHGHGNGYGTMRQVAGPCCAIGAGVLFAGLPMADSDDNDTACVRFAAHYGVSEYYARGVSNGFEWSLLSDLGHLGSEMAKRDRDDYFRGIEVGRAAFQALFQS